jgi:adenylate cyclase, class 2
MPGASNQEIEIKLRVADAAQARALLRRAGFRISRRRVFESNAVFDAPGLDLRREGRLLRLRQVGRDVVLTFKGPPSAGKYKSREELETRLEGAEGVRAILERLGYRITFLYEKYRTEYRDAAREGLATVDETPIGNFLELEGPPEWIDRIAGVLGFTEADYITFSYASLYWSWCEQQGIAPTHMIFPGSANSTKS